MARRTRPENEPDADDPAGMGDDLVDTVTASEEAPDQDGDAPAADGGPDQVAGFVAASLGLPVDEAGRRIDAMCNDHEREQLADATATGNQQLARAAMACAARRYGKPKLR